MSLRRTPFLLLALVLAACGSAAPSSTEQPTVTPGSADGHATPTASSSSPASDAPSDDQSAEPTGDDIGDPFTCDLPIVDAGTAPIANIVDIRTATHDGYDRFVFEFEQGTPELTLDRAEPPFTHDASGMPIDVEGEAFLGLVMRGGTKQTDAGTSSYDGPTEFTVDFHTLRHAVEGGDFERQSTWYFGLTEAECVRLLVLEDPARVVIDVEH